MGFLDDFTAQVEAAKPKCKRCGAVSAAKITYTQKAGHRSTWAEQHTCLDHAVDAIDHLHSISNVIDVKWLDD
ncbi:hypothetical protein AOT96_29095 [Rhodococcus sp. 008]|nr:hypothetical protein AOT96_29095 [Rhodococcus sp. 008]